MESQPFLCYICSQPVDLDTSKIDEHGRVAHQECYATVVLHRPKKPASIGLLSRIFAKIVRH